MKNRNDEAAFPVPIGQTDERQWGMSLRDWFAAKAITGVIDTCRGESAKNWAKDCYHIADAMMEEREAKQ